jgi:hypothetical protein
MISLALALTGLALADEPEGRETNPAGLHLSGGVVFLPETPVNTLGARLVAEKDSYAGVDVRLAPSGTFVARGGVGFDVLGRSNLDLKLGLWMGGVGFRDDAPTIEVGPALGTEVALGFTFDRLWARHRWMVGVGDSRLGTLLSERETQVGWRVVDDLSIYGQHVHYAPGTPGGLGLGASYVF